MTDPIPVGGLGTALGLGPHELVSLVGGGGKTTALFSLGQQLAGRTVLTTTTKMHRTRTDGVHVLVGPTDEALDRDLDEHGTVLVWRAGSGDKALGVTPDDCDRWFDLADHVLVEADGARRRPLTAPRPFEPIVPARTTTVVANVGAAALGRVIADSCHRPMRVAAVAGCSPSERLTPERLARVLLSTRGLRKDVPPHARFAVAVHAVTEADRGFVEALTAHLDGVPLIAVRSFS